MNLSSEKKGQNAYTVREDDNLVDNDLNKDIAVGSGGNESDHLSKHQDVQHRGRRDWEEGTTLSNRQLHRARGGKGGGGQQSACA